MKIEYLGHSTFLITSESGLKILADPYATSSDLTYGEINLSADIVTVSHSHFDHSNVAAVKGNPEVIRKPGESEAKGTRFKGIETYHDEAGGRLRGNNIVFCFAVDGIKLCHLGDLGHKLDYKQVTGIGEVDVLFIPVGGRFTISAGVATEVCHQLKPKVVIPMHYKTEKGLPVIAEVDEFLKGKADVKRISDSQVGFKTGKLPSPSQIIVLNSAL